MKDKKKILIGLIIAALVIVVFVVYKLVLSSDSKQSEIQLVKEEQVIEDIEKDVIKYLSEITINENNITEDNYDSKKASYENIKFREKSDSLVIEIDYIYNDEIEYKIPLRVVYELDDNNYELSKVENTNKKEETSTVTFSKCSETLKDENGNTPIDIINNKFGKYDNLTFKSAYPNEEKTHCEYVYSGVSNRKYINKEDSIVVNLNINKEDNKYIVNSETFKTTDKVTFNLKGKYKANYKAADYFKTNSVVSFEITDVNDNKITIADGGYYGGRADVTKGKEYRFNFTDTETSVVYDYDYEYYTFDLNAIDASNGMKTSMNFRIYDDQILFYCSYNNKTDGCVELKLAEK